MSNDVGAVDARTLEGRVRGLEVASPTLVGGRELYDPEGSGTKGVYAEHPGATPKYFPSAGRQTGTDLQVARLYLTGIDDGGLTSTDFGLWNGAEGTVATLFEQGYVGFLLQQITEEHTEKAQILALNGDGYAAYFMGQNPVSYSFSGFLLNTRQDQWRRLFSDFYDKIFRGSKVAAHRHLVQIAYDQQIVTGVMTNMVQVLEAQFEMYSRLQFTMLVKDVYRLSPSQDIIKSTFLGSVKDFGEAGLRVPDAETTANFTKSAFIAPPPKPKRKGSKKTNCSVSYRNVISQSAAHLRVIGTVDINKKCNAGKDIQRLKAEQSKLTTSIAKLGGKTDPKSKAALRALEGKLDRVGPALNALIGQSIRADAVEDLLLKEDQEAAWAQSEWDWAAFGHTPPDVPPS